MKKSIIYTFLICSLFSCTEYIYLPKDKVPSLNNNEIVYFEDSLTNEIDTFRIDFRDIMHLNNENNYLEYIEIYYNRIYSNKTLLSIYIGPAGDNDVSFSVYNYSWETVNDFKSNFTIHGITYPNVCIRHNNSIESIPNTIYYTYPDGIIRYEYKDGRVYNLVSK